MRWLLPLILAGVLLGCGMVPPKVDLSGSLKFSHRRHLDVGCDGCHAGVEKSTRGTAGRYVAKGEHGGCVECHEEEVKGRCIFCHVKGKDRVKIPRFDRGLQFSHSSHASRVKKGCASCHPAAHSAERPGTPLVPSMTQCTESCHRSATAELRCNLCHSQLWRQRRRPQALFGHQGDFVRRHGTLARDTGRCASCHDQTFCGDCHAKTAALPLAIRYPDRIQASFIHRGEFVGRHATEAQARPESCRRCHGTRHCSSCHELRGVFLPTVSSTMNPSGTVHGAGFMTPEDPGFHGVRARRNISACASCHDRGPRSICINCHQTGGLGGSPHPSGFRRGDKKGACRSLPMCRSCHLGGSGCS